MKKLIVFDLDGTLAESKSSIDAEMAVLIGKLLGIVKVAVISGGDWPQFQKQVLANLIHDAHLGNLSLLPACGTKFYRYEGDWEKIYSEDFTAEEKSEIVSSLEQAVDASGFKVGKIWGDTIEDRGSQITFSALGQTAPLEEKKKWDADFAKRKAIKSFLDERIPEFSVRLGGDDLHRCHQARHRQGLRDPKAAGHFRDRHRGDDLHRRCAVSGRQRLPRQGGRRRVHPGARPQRNQTGRRSDSRLPGVPLKATAADPLRFEQGVRRAWTVARLSAQKFMRIDGTNWASSFAFNAFFSLFPLILLFVVVASMFIDRQSAGRAIIAYMEGYVPLDGEMRAGVFGALAGVIEAREGTGIVALLILVWSALQCFITLVQVTNRAWGEETYTWWRLPLKGMGLLGVTAGGVLLGMAAPAVASAGKAWLIPANGFGTVLYALWGYVIPLLVLFLALALFYRLAPQRKTRFAEVWIAAACATVLLQTTELGFVVYLKNFATLNAVYGVLGGIMALLLWIYLSGCGFVFGACLCAAQAEGKIAQGEPALTLNGNENGRDR
jgi:HAD superfamily hydrolase (TIGR01484 family)